MSIAETICGPQRTLALGPTKAGIRYRYYVSLPHLYGQSKTASVGSVSRIPAPHVEETVASALDQHLVAEKEKPKCNAVRRTDREIILAYVSRIDVQNNRLTVKLKSQDQDDDGPALVVAWEKPPSRKFKEILLPHNKLRADVRPIRAERRTRLVAAIVRGRRWLNEIVSGEIATAEEIAVREKCSVRHVNMTISLAFLAPGLVKAAIEGRLPRGVGVERLRDAPSEWTQQFAMLGLNPQ
jgi:site-specific DNA recombinase